MKNALWSRRGFLGIVVALPAVAGAACGSPDSVGAASGSSAGGSSPGTSSGGGLATGGSTSGASSGGGSTNDAGQDADASVEEHVCSTKYPRIDLKVDCGAVGDGQTNDTAALAKAADIIQKAGGGELTIPPGVYIVGEQTKKADPKAAGPFYATVDMFSVQNLACLKISGYGALLRIADGLHYGGFDPMTGLPVDVTGGTSFAASVGHIFLITGSDDVLIEGLELDGNNEKLVLGGQWGDIDRQTKATGILVNKCQNVTIVDVHTHHHGLDGIAVEYQPGPPPKKMPHHLLRVVSEYNGRQGISWIGGWGLECTDCKFNHTGRAINNGQPMKSKPGDGLDIEPNGGTTEQSREGLFTRCEFIDNVGNGIEAANGDGGYSTFDDCTIWGTTNYSMWVVKPGMKFTNCRIHGTLVRGSDGRATASSAPNAALATKFEDCTFEDKEWTDGNVFRAGALCSLSAGYEGMSWTRCTFINNKVRAVEIGDVNTTEIFDSCTFVHGNTGLTSGTYQSSFAGSRIKSCHFTETAQISAGNKAYSISVTSVVVAAPAPGDAPTHVDGPKVKWNNASTGPTGDIAPGTYS